MASKYNIQQAQADYQIIGDHGQILTGGHTDRQALHRLAGELSTAVTAHAAELPDAEQLSGAAEELRAELREPQPRSDRVAHMLQTITAGAGTVDAVTQAAEKLSRLLGV